MTETTSEAAPTPPPAPAPAPAPAVPTAEAAQATILEAYLQPIFYCVVSGAVSTLPGFRSEVVLIACARILGKLIGQLYVGDEIMVMKLRKNCRDAMKVALAEAPIGALPPKTQPKPATAIELAQAPPKPALPAVPPAAAPAPAT